MAGMERGDHTRRSFAPYLALIGFAALPSIMLGLVKLVAADGAGRRCPGMSLCLSPADLAGILAVILIPVMALWAAAACMVLVTLRRRPAYRARPAIVQGLLPVAPALVIALLLVVLL